MILYLEDPKDSTQKLLKLINKYGKVEGYKINMPKSIPFLYTNNESAQKEMIKTIPFTIASKAYLEINLTKEVKDLYNEKYRTLKKEMMKTSEDGRTFHVHR
uniref:Uncharacterized protein n=1 Tax=Spermophilus dauricus TaxID=99837 RepID=A0A8C9PA73_SPEDA